MVKKMSSLALLSTMCTISVFSFSLLKVDSAIAAGEGDCRPGVIVIPSSCSKATGDATADQVLTGTTFSNSSAVGVSGSMPNVGAQVISPGSSAQTIAPGYHDGMGFVTGDSNLTDANIASGTTIFGVTGSALLATGDATAGQVLTGTSFSNSSAVGVSGSMPNVGTQNISPGTSAQSITAGYHNGMGSVAGDTDLLSGNIRSTTTIFGVSGDTNVVNTSTGTAVEGDLLSGKVAWVDGSEVTGNMATQTLSASTTTVPAGYYAATNLATVDTDLVAANITCGKNIFGVVGTAAYPGVICSAGQLWMDRNLGASRVATSSTDTLAYGDLYQWGRLADGHERRDSGTTASLSSTDIPGHGDFITLSTSPYDWRDPQNDALWQGVSGTNNPCPNGFRVPTAVELETEKTSWTTNNAAGAFASPAKLVVAGYRYHFNGTVNTAGSYGYYWSGTVDGTYSRGLDMNAGYANMNSYYRAYGFSVRCLVD